MSGEAQDFGFTINDSVTASPDSTQPRQVRLVKCAILAPGLELRAKNKDDANELANYGFDVSQFIQRIDIWENIFDNTISAAVTLLENYGLPEYLPLVGVETVALVFEIDTFSGVKQFAKSFRLWKVGDQTFPRHNYRLYTLHLSTNEFVKSISGRVCRRFRGTAEENVKDILSNDLGILNGKSPFALVNGVPSDEPTFGPMDITIPNYTPLQAINYFTSLAQTMKVPREANFFFFETLDGFHFQSIQSLIENGLANPDLFSAEYTFIVNPGQVSTAPNVSELSVLNAIIRVHQEKAFDLLTDIAGGTLRSQTIGFDFLARQLTRGKDGDSRYTEQFDNATHLNEFPFYPVGFDLTTARDARLFVVSDNRPSLNSDYINSRERIIEDLTVTTVPVRNRQLREFQHLQTLIDLPGQPNLRAGAVVNIIYPSSPLLEGKQNETITSSQENRSTPYYSGPHLVTSVRHIMTTKGPGSMEYRMNIRVTTDSLGTGLYGTSNTEGL